MTLLIVAAVAALLAVVGVVLYNKLVKLNVGVDEGFAQIEVQLKRRNDLIPNLVETVKGYAGHESATLQAVTEARSQVMNAGSSVAETAAADSALTAALRGLNIVVEAYPDLKASANFLQLQEELTTTENKISFARQYYNDTVRQLNTKVATIPTNVVAKIAKIGPRDFYEIVDPAERETPTVSF